MDDSASRIARLLAAAGYEGLVPETPRGGGTSARLVPLGDADGRRAAAKLAGPGLPARRVDAEAHVLGVIGPRAELPVPALLGRAGDDLLIEWVDGEPARATEILTALEAVHATPLEVADVPRLAPWGMGSGDQDRAFRRRARRLERRRPGFLAVLAPDRRADWDRRLRTVIERFEPASARLRAWPDRRLLHGDLHPGHAIRVPPSEAGPEAGVIRLLDWQHASVGPPSIDVVRVLVESPVEPQEALGSAAEAGLRLAHRHVPGATPEHLADAVTVTLAGLVSGFGARTQTSLDAWERRIIDTATAPDGWAAACVDGM